MGRGRAQRGNGSFCTHKTQYIIDMPERGKHSMVLHGIPNAVHDRVALVGKTSLDLCSYYVTHFCSIPNAVHGLVTVNRKYIMPKFRLIHFLHNSVWQICFLVKKIDLNFSIIK